jgi:hypothetical protein
MLYRIKIALAIAIAYTFYLGVTSIAALLPTYTGLILTIEGVVLMGIIMQILSRYKDLKFSELLGWSGVAQSNSVANNFSLPEDPHNEIK